MNLEASCFDDDILMHAAHDITLGGSNLVSCMHAYLYLRNTLNYCTHTSLTNLHGLLRLAGASSTSSLSSDTLLTRLVRNGNCEITSGLLMGIE